MAASDPSPYVATPTGTLQGVAAFSWDGSAWQPSGRAGPDVATPTGVLQGVAVFNADSGATWQPSGRAGPSVATPTGVLDGVAIHYWDGAAWRPEWTQQDGWAINTTPSGALRGVAAFTWDGAAWQPAGQARPRIGDLDGVALFGWNGAAWAAAQGPTLDLVFTRPPLDPRITFTRASTATYFDATGTMQTATTNAPRFDYDPVTHVLRGLLIEDARTNVAVNSQNFTGGGWGPVATTLVTGQPGAPDGTATLTRVVETTASSAHYVGLPLSGLTASATYTFSVYAQAQQDRYLQLAMDDGVSSGGYATFDLQSGTISGAATAMGTGAIGTARIQAISGGTYRCSMATTIGTATGGRVLILTSNIPAPAFAPGYVGNAANGLLIWGAQLEAGTFPSSYIVTGAGAVTRSADLASMPAAGWYSATASTLAVDAIFEGATGSYQTTVALDDGTQTNFGRFYCDINSASLLAQLIGGTSYTPPALGAFAIGARVKAAMAWQAGTQSSAMNGVLGTGASGALIPGGITTLRLGAFAGPAQILYGWVQRVRYWPRVLSNTEMQSATT